MQTLSAPHQTKNSSAIHNPLKIIALGDSVVYGFGDHEGGGWVERLRRQWMNPNIPGHIIYNLGIRGNGVIQVAQRLEQEFRHRGELRNSQPDLIILSVGVNDSARLGCPTGRYYTNFQTFQTQLGQLLDQAQQLCPVLFVGMVPVNESQMPCFTCFYYNHGDQYHYKEATKLACQMRQIPYLDLFDLWMGRGEKWCQGNLCEDGLHPNVKGYQAILQDVLNWQPIAQL